mgnify:CR=1 FL=1
MKLVNKLIVIYREYIKRAFVTLMLMLICVISFYMTDRTWNTYMKNRCETGIKRKAYSISPYNINKIKFSTRSVHAEQSDMMEGLASIEEISAYGLVLSTNGRFGDELVDFVISDSSIADMCNTGVSRADIEKMQDEWGDTDILWLGSSYRGVYEIGQRCQTMSSECVVVGFLKDDAQWLVNETITLEKPDLSESGLVVTKDTSKYDWGGSLEYTTPVYYVSDYKDNDVIKSKLMDYQAEKGIRAAITNEGEQLDKDNQDNAITNDKTFIASVLLYVIAIVAISAVTIIECLINRRDYAIFIINGISRKAVYSMILIKNLILIIVSALAAWLYCQWETFGKIIVQTAGEYGNELNYTAKIMAHCIYVPLIIAAEAVIMTVISCIVPVVYLHGKGLIDLMKK